MNMKNNIISFTLWFSNNTLYLRKIDAIKLGFLHLLDIDTDYFELASDSEQILLFNLMQNKVKYSCTHCEIADISLFKLENKCAKFFLEKEKFAEDTGLDRFVRRLYNANKYRFR